MMLTSRTILNWSEKITLVSLSVLIFVTILTARNSASIVSFFSISESFSERVLFWWQLLINPTTSFGILSLLILATFSFLASFQVLLWVKIYYRQRQNVCAIEKSAHFTPLVGSLAALFGIGCAACGTALIVSFLSVLGVSGLLTLLPLQGIEIGLLGILLLLYSNHRFMRFL